MPAPTPCKKRVGLGTPSVVPNNCKGLNIVGGLCEPYVGLNANMKRTISFALLLGVCLHLEPQQLDSVGSSADRTSTTITDEIRNPRERAALIAVLKATGARKILPLARSYLLEYPQSAFLAIAAEAAARSSFDLGDLKPGLDYARFSLSLLPENPLLLVAVADVQALQEQNEAALQSARDAMEYLDRFDRPATIPEHAWPNIKRQHQGTAWFVMGRALVNEALQLTPGPQRIALLEQAVSAFKQASMLKPADMEITYLLGTAYLYQNDVPRAATAFAKVYQQSPQYAPRAREQLSILYQSLKAAQPSLDAFVDSLQNTAEVAPYVAIPSPVKMPGYAGSDICKSCHADLYQQWSQSGMARMLRPYQAKNIIGDFQKNNEFRGGDNTLFARMNIQGGRHYINIKEPDAPWHQYPVDYTIGSKWQQAYATTLPGGQIHVFPMQYSTVEGKWLNYWKLIDSPGSERANLSTWARLDASTSYQLNCATCHTSQLRNVKGGGFAPDNLVFREPGVGCEMCHGPSSTHVDKMTHGDFSPKAPLDPPVDFNHLDNRNFVAICAQCHSQSSVHKGNAQGELNYSSTGTFFLKNVALPLNEFTRDAFFKDGRLSQTTFMVEALERSKCFRKGAVSCGTCHDPHRHDEASNLTSLKFKEEPDRMCTGCHSQFREEARAVTHTHHSATSEASRCVSCHMPRIMYGMLFRVRSHQIDDVPNADMTARFGQQDSPNACLLCHAEKTPEWLQAQLKSWKVR